MFKRKELIIYSSNKIININIKNLRNDYVASWSFSESLTDMLRIGFQNKKIVIMDNWVATVPKNDL